MFIRSQHPMLAPERLRSAYRTARDALLAERVPAGHWVGELSTSALSTATAVMALHITNPFEHRELIDGGMKWLVEHQNEDGGWGDTVKSVSNISTTMLVRAALRMIALDKDFPAAVEKVEEYLNVHGGRRPALRAEAIRRRYGKDRTFSVPILMTCALAKLIPWEEVPRLPFEAAALPQSWYRFARMPVVSYALPALIAIGQCVHHHRVGRINLWFPYFGRLTLPVGNPITGPLRWLTKGRTLRVLRRVQPTSGGYLEATPLTSFVVMALSSIRRRRRPAEQQVIDEGIRFIMNSVRPDGSWPIDTNLATWVTTLSVNALAAAGDLESLDTKEQILTWLLNQQYKERHPYTGADPGGWAWTDLPGGVPDCDDTPGVMLAITTLGYNEDLPKDVPFGAGFEAINWLTSLQNRDGGWPTFCRGWGVLPFDRSGADLTAHALRALTCWSMKWFGHVAGGDPKNQPDYDEMVEKVGSWWDAWSRVEIDFDNSAVDGIRFLSEQQRPDGSWLPLWFGNQHAKDDINPVYGTARVLAAYRDLNMTDSPECQRGVTYLLSVQNADGGWGGAKDCPSSVEETALAVEVLVDLVQPREGEAPAEPNHVPGSAGASHVPGSAGASPSHEIQRGLAWLVEAVESGRFREPSPIGFYFAKLWYFEKLYPLIFTVAALGRARLTSSPAAVGSA